MGSRPFQFVHLVENEDYCKRFVAGTVVGIGADGGAALAAVAFADVSMVEVNSSDHLGDLQPFKNKIIRCYSNIKVKKKLLLPD